MKTAVEHQTPSLAWNHSDQQSAHTARAALPYMLNQVDPGVNCPLTMTYAAVAAVRNMPAVADEYLHKLTAPHYDHRDVPMSEKLGVTMGMSMTEKQGGSDVRANTTYAVPIDSSKQGPGEGYHLTGHKWFTSAPMSDAFLTLAQTENGLSCFLVPRWLPSGERNKGFQIVRLKDKMGDKVCM